MISKETQYGFELSNGIDIAVATNSFRSVRGRPVLCAILDETAFWRDESSANPDQETFNAIKPAWLACRLAGLLASARHIANRPALSEIPRSLRQGWQQDTCDQGADAAVKPTYRPIHY
jgi:hypothetical protein